MVVQNGLSLKALHRLLNTFEMLLVCDCWENSGAPCSWKWKCFEVHSFTHLNIAPSSMRHDVHHQKTIAQVFLLFTTEQRTARVLNHFHIVVQLLIIKLQFQCFRGKIFIFNNANYTLYSSGDFPIWSASW